MKALRQKMTLDLPLTDIAYLENISRKKGWVLMVSVENKKTKPDVHSVVQSLKGSIQLSENFDYKSELADSLLSEYESLV